MKLILFTLVIGLSSGAEIKNPSSCHSFPCQIFNDDFNYLDLNVWEHEITMGGGGNGEFQVYLNSRNVSYTHDGNLFIKPNLLSDWQNERFLSEGELNIWGPHGRNQRCTATEPNGCYKRGTPNDIINPIVSGRLRTKGVFSFKYGQVDVRAKLPRGAWLWPAIWLFPENSAYGIWPRSGEIDIVESRGNDIYGGISNHYAGSTAHWGPSFEQNRYQFTHSTYKSPDGKSFSDGYHTWSFIWNRSSMTTLLDGRQVLRVDPHTNFWDFGKFPHGVENPWSNRGKMAPFDQQFHLLINLAVGSTGGYFPDNIHPANPAKPWQNHSPTAKRDFWAGRGSWLPTWQSHGRISDNAALKVDYIRVWKLSSDDVRE